MIFVTLGNAPKDFSRLAGEVDRLAPSLNEIVMVQCGYTKYRFEFSESINFLDPETMQEYIKNSSIVITHGGWGTISQCIALNKKLIAVPRIKGVEHNHSQDQLVKALEKKDHLIAVYDISFLKNAIERARYFVPQPLIRGNAGNTITRFLNIMAM